MGINEEAQRIVNQRAAQAKALAERKKAAEAARRKKQKEQRDARKKKVHKIFGRKAQYERFLAGRKPQFVDEFLAWMIKNNVRYDARYGWKLGAGSVGHFHGYQPTYYYCGEQSGGEPIYFKTSIFINRNGVAVSRCDECGHQDFMTPGFIAMRQRIALAIADSGSKLSWP